MASAHPHLTVITVTYNEQENIRLFIEAVNGVFSRHALRGEIIVVDDSSPDGTGAIVQELQKKYPATTLITRPGKQGIGSAYFRGLQDARGDVVAFLDADLSHPPEILPEMYAQARARSQSLPGAIVFGSRYLEKTTFETDVPHRIGTYLLNKWVRFWLHTGMHDHTNGYIAAPRETLHKIIKCGEERGLRPFEHILYGITIAALAGKLSIPCREIKATYNKRQHGETKIPFLWGLKVVLGDMAYALKVRSRLR